ncbi:hypothetical protein [Mycolicibacter icosiumassiliensis]|uniref:hypothetical protein n=1 Tax=Mycolicibacter icosiumassiliensis TaxID=1792835 RepID=UPI00082A7179|nr:hypothetical protein [Mycolicibacter icosiumassiliensis]
MTLRDHQSRVDGSADNRHQETQPHIDSPTNVRVDHSVETILVETKRATATASSLVAAVPIDPATMSVRPAVLDAQGVRVAIPFLSPRPAYPGDAVLEPGQSGVTSSVNGDHYRESTHVVLGGRGAAVSL